MYMCVHSSKILLHTWTLCSPVVCHTVIKRLAYYCHLVLCDLSNMSAVIQVSKGRHQLLLTLLIGLPGLLQLFLLHYNYKEVIKYQIE